MRINALGALLMLGLAATAQAQHRESRHAQYPVPELRPAPQIAVPQTQIAVAQAGLLPQVPGPRLDRIPFLPGPSSHLSPNPGFTYAGTYSTGFGRPISRTRYSGMPGVVYISPQYLVPQYLIPDYVVPPPQGPLQSPALQERTARQLTTGNLALHVEPANAQVFVDGYFLGLAEDFDSDRGELALEAGAHKVQLTASGYESVTLEVELASNETVTYQNAMKLVPIAAPAAPAAPIEHKMIYVIPGCYLGNVPPNDAGLPATCDLRQVRTFQP
jgi:hypothetical protein